MQAGARLKHVNRNEPDRHRDGGQDLEIDQGLQPEPPKLTHARDMRQSVHDRAKDDGGQHHPEQRDERVAQRLHRDGNARGDDAQHHGEQDADEDLNVELA